MEPRELAGLEARLQGTRWAGLHFWDELGSTQDAALTGPTGSRIHWADRQTAGRGRQGRRWHDGGRDLAVTFRLEDWRPTHPEMLALAVPVAVALAAEPHLDRQLFCRWPNDVLATTGHGGMAKVAGILVDGSGRGQGSPVWRIGIGINVNRRSFPADLDQPATSLAHLANRELDRGALLADLAVHLDRQLELAAEPDPEPLFTAYRRRLYGMGQIVQVQVAGAGVGVRGRLVGLDRDGLEIEGQGKVPLAHVGAIRW